VPDYVAAAAPLAYGIVVVGASWGGLNALSRLVSDVDAGFPLPIAIVQHRSKESDHLLAHLLQDRTELKVKEVEDKEPIAPGSVYVAPPDYHLLVDLLEDGPHFSLSVDPPVRYSRPSIDVAFVAAADAFGARVVGVVLTGANEDGAAGLRRIADRGGYAIVQQPDTAEIRTMPQAALNAVPNAEVLPLDRIGARLTKLGGMRVPARLRELPPRTPGPARAS
jgi:two-component system chemotaxis response regulator CheB